MRASFIAKQKSQHSDLSGEYDRGPGVRVSLRAGHGVKAEKYPARWARRKSAVQRCIF